MSSRYSLSISRVSAQLKEGVAHDFAAFFRELNKLPADELGLQAAVASIAAFFEKLNSEINLLSDVLHLNWKNVGVTTNGAVVLMEIENRSNKRRRKMTVQAECLDMFGCTVMTQWLQDLYSCAVGLPVYSPWRLPMHTIALHVFEWWPDSCLPPPGADVLEEMAATTYRAALVGVCWDLWGRKRATWVSEDDDVCWDRFGFRVDGDTEVVMNEEDCAPMRIARVVMAYQLHCGPEARIRVAFDMEKPFEDLKNLRNNECEVVALRSLCTVRALRHWCGLWFARTVRRRWRRDACQVMQRSCGAGEDVTQLVVSFL